MPLGQIFLSLFLALQSLHLGLSMELTIVIWAGIGLSVLGSLRLVQVERPTWGLSFVLVSYRWVFSAARCSRTGPSKVPGRRPTGSVLAWYSAF